MSNSSLPIVIRLLRKNCTDKSEDDILTIYRETDDYDDESESYRVRYVDGEGNLSKKQLRHEFYLSGNELDRYLDSFFMLISSDIEPFESIQILAPGFPSVMFNVSSVYAVREYIISALSLLTDVRAY